MNFKRKRCKRHGVHWLRTQYRWMGNSSSKNGGRKRHSDLRQALRAGDE